MLYILEDGSFVILHVIIDGVTLYFILIIFTFSQRIIYFLFPVYLTQFKKQRF